jgi:peptide/nickel transport system substrate-binding protein
VELLKKFKVVIIVFVTLLVLYFLFPSATSRKIVRTKIKKQHIIRKDVKNYVTLSAYTRLTRKKITEFHEAPVLSELVKQGKLPKVEDRLPDEPMVTVPYEQVGTYGGTLRTEGLKLIILMHHGLFIQNSAGNKVLPDLAESYTFAKDYKSLTIRLRKGVRWSDGHPFTVDDILFWWEDEMNNKDLNPGGPWGSYAYASFHKISDHILKIKLKYPTASFLAEVSHPFTLGQCFFYNPKHYLKKWHIKYNPKADELAKEEGFGSWTEAYYYHEGKWELHKRENVPTLYAWEIEKVTSTYIVARRNPYFWQIDTAGNQLPYIDRIIATFTKETQPKLLSMLGGQLDYVPGMEEIVLDDYPFLKENEEKCGYQIRTQPGDYQSSVTVTFNPLVPNKAIRKLFHDFRFRKALSIGMDRDAINDAVFLGLGTPRQHGPLPIVSYYKKEWGEYCIQYDLQKANALLDEMGLIWDDDHKYRIGFDGKPVEILVESGHGGDTEAGVAEVLAGQYAKLGIKLVIKTEKLVHSRLKNDEYELLVCDNGMVATELGLQSQEKPFWDYAFGWEKWLIHMVNKEFFNRQQKVPDKAVEPPDEWKQVARWIQKAKMISPDTPEYKMYKQKATEYRIKQLWHLGTVYKVPIIDLVSNRLKNYPNLDWFGWNNGGLVMLQSQQWYLLNK